MLEQLDQSGEKWPRGSCDPSSRSLVHIEVDTDCKGSCILYYKTYPQYSQLAAEKVIECMIFHGLDYHYVMNVTIKLYHMDNKPL